MLKLRLSLDNQIFLSNRTENMGIYKHYLILMKQLHAMEQQFNTSIPRFVNHSKILKKKHYPLAVFATLVKKFDPRVFWTIARKESALAAQRSDFIFTTFFYSSWFDVYSETNSLSKMIVCNHDCINENLLKSKYEISNIGQSKKEFLFASKAIYTPSLWSFEKTLEFYPKVRGKIFLIPHYIEFSKDSVQDAVIQRFNRSRARVGYEKLRFLHVGSTESYKNFDLIYEMLIESEITVDLVLLGVNPSGTLIDQVRHLKSLGHNVISDPFLSEEEKNRHYLSADVLLMPSLDEGFSFPTYEAAIVGLPIVKYSKNPWGFSSLTITNTFKVNAIGRALKTHYDNSNSAQLSRKIIKELNVNNESSTMGLKMLMDFLSESK